MIPITNTGQAIGFMPDTLDIYLKLKAVFDDQQLFLLESLSGPLRDRQKSLVGFNPCLTLTLRESELTLNGDPALCGPIDAHLQSSSLVQAQGEQTYLVLDLLKVWDLLRDIQSLFDVTYHGENTDARFGFFGYFGYDAVRYIESLPHVIKEKSAIPDVILKLYQGIIYTDIVQQKTFLSLSNFGVNLEKTYAANDIIAQIAKSSPPSVDILAQPIPQPASVTDSVEKATYLKWVEKALYHISIGDIYQIQLGHHLEIKSDISPFHVYQRMRALNPSPYMFFAAMDDVTIIGASPELFARKTKEQEVTMRPIAGTIRRGKNEEENQTLTQQLQNDPKEQAEHIMLVDLCRNDIGRICLPNTLNVTELMVVERYSHVFHLVSNVIGTTTSAYDPYHVLAATFPQGTVTGAPRVRAMELIEETENARRGLYAGCIGFIDFRGTFETALCIRTACYKNNTYHIQASAGIVADSIPTSEWAETIGKLSGSYLAITGKELKNETFIN